MTCRMTAALTGAALVAFGLSACSSDAQSAPQPTSATPTASASTTAAPTGSATTGGTATAVTTPGASSSAPAPTSGPATTASRPPDNPAPTSIPTVARATAAPTRVSAPEQAATSPVSYGDGVTVKLGSFKRGSETDQGPGSMVGAPTATVTVSVHNGSSAPLDLSAVVVSARYGSPELMAQARYGQDCRDFVGTVAPGADADGVYSFVIPADAGDRMRFVVDLDGGHSPAVFHGTPA